MGLLRANSDIAFQTRLRQIVRFEIHTFIFRYIFLAKVLTKSAAYQHHYHEHCLVCQCQTDAANIRK